MAEKSEEVLRKLGFEFIKNETNRLVEFEVQRPAYFRVVVEMRSDPNARNLMLLIPPHISARSGCTLEIRFGIDDSPEGIRNAERSAREFIWHLVTSLPEKPWARLGFRERLVQEKKWRILLNEKKKME
jgi:hypothetical protein